MFPSIRICVCSSLSRLNDCRSQRSVTASVKESLLGGKRQEEAQSSTTTRLGTSNVVSRNAGDTCEEENERGGERAMEKKFRVSFLRERDVELTVSGRPACAFPSDFRGGEFNACQAAV